MSKITDDILQYYSQRHQNFGLTAQGVGYKNQQAQDITFAQLCKIIQPPFEAFSVNDLGCGVGNLYDFMRQVLPDSKIDYMGYDVLPEMITGSQELHKGKPLVQFEHLMDSAQMRQADYIIGAGIFNLKFGIAEHEWIAYILKTINDMAAKSTKGFAFNILTKYSDKEYMKPEELYYADPMFFFDYCKRNYSRNVALLHDYTLYEFTILVRKMEQ